MLRPMKVFIITSFALAATVAFPVWAEKQPDQFNLRDYLVDLGSGAISASALVGVSGSAIQNIHTPQDLLLAFNPAAGGSSKGGFAISLTPGRTSLAPISGNSYLNSKFYRLLAGTSISYAENKAMIAGADYKKTAFSIETVFYYDDNNDPIISGYATFKKCMQDDKFNNILANAAVEKELAKNKSAQELAEAELKWAQAKLDVANKVSICQKEGKAEPKWNTTKFSISYGAGRIRADNGGATESLGRVLAANAVIHAGTDAAINLSARKTMNEVDLATLGKTPVNQNSTLAAARYTIGVADTKSWRALAEVSNNSTSTHSSTTATYKSAVGMDVRIQDGMWLELRYGKIRSLDNGKMENKALMTFNWSPTSTLLKN